MRASPTKSLWVIISHFVLNGALNIFVTTKYAPAQKNIYLVMGILGVITGVGLLLQKKIFRIIALCIVLLPLLLMPLAACGWFSAFRFACVPLYLVLVPVLFWEFSILRDKQKMYKSNHNFHSIAGSARSE